MNIDDKISALIHNSCIEDTVKDCPECRDLLKRIYAKGAWDTYNDLLAKNVFIGVSPQSESFDKIIVTLRDSLESQGLKRPW